MVFKYLATREICNLLSQSLLASVIDFCYSYKMCSFSMSRVVKRMTLLQ